MHPHDVAAVLAVAGLLATAPLRADEPARPSGLMTFPGVKVERPAGASPTPSRTPAARADARVYVDATSGRIRERTQEDAAAEAARADASSPASLSPELIRGPNGIVGVRLDARMAVRSVVTRADDGRLVGTCAENPPGTATAAVAPSTSRAPTAARAAGGTSTATPAGSPPNGRDADDDR